jgi:predicted transcriptional regulator
MTPLSVFRCNLKAAGYRPIPVNGKKPPMEGWSQIDASEEDIKTWDNKHRHARNTGVLTKLVPALDIDILFEDAAEAVERLVRERYEEAGPILVRIGLAPKRAVLFRTNDPFKKIPANLIAPNGSEGQKLELLADGQQLVIAGTHPKTRKPYVWFGGEPGAIKREELPYIHEEQAKQLVEEAAELLCRDFGYKRAPKRQREAYGGEPGGADDWAFLYDNIHHGRALHDSLRDLAAKLVRSGMGVGAAINSLRALMDKSDCEHDVRWVARRDDIPRLVESAVEIQPPPPAAEPRTLSEVHEVFRRWLGKDYDLATLDAMLAVTASGQMPGDPAWLLIISGPGNAKTETIGASSGLGARVVSTITSDAALLSASPRKQRAKNATGGLLCEIGEHGILAVKDFTSILSMDRNLRGSVLAALREIHDGHWVRNVGTDGGLTLTWKGRITVIGACTTAWDQAHSVVATMGDRFVLIRSDSNLGRRTSGQKAMRNTGKEVEMRKEMAGAVAGVVSGIDPSRVYLLSEDDEDTIVDAANLVTLARTGVELDYRGDVVDAHAPEMPTRFAKQLVQIMRGAVAIGMAQRYALQLVIRCARDSMPQLRLTVLRDMAANPSSSVADVRRRLQKPRATVSRTLQALHTLGLLVCEEEEVKTADKTVEVWRYSLADDVNLAVLDDENAERLI